MDIKKGSGELSLDQFRRYAEFTDSFGKTWGVRIFTLRDIATFQTNLYAMFEAMMTADFEETFYAVLAAQFPQLMTCCLYDKDNGIRTRIRRWRGLTDYSNEYVTKNFPARDFKAMFEVAVKENMGETLQEFIDKTNEKIKKKTIESQTKKTGRDSSASSGNGDGA